MIRVKLFFALCIAGFLTACCANAQTISYPVQNTYAVVVGISQYQNPFIPRLTYADTDATLFAEWLQSKAGGSVPGYQINLFTNENATIANVYAALDRLKSKARENDLVYIYFSGHGDIETRDTISKGYLLAWNSPATNYRNNAISVADINENANILSTINKAKVIIITDACHSGKMAGDFYKGRQLTAANLQLVLNNQVRLASCEANEEAAEGPSWGGGRGVFSYYLLRGLLGLATPESNGVIKLNSLETFMNTSFSRDENLILEKHKQNPVIDGSPLFPIATVDTETRNSLIFSGSNPAKIKSTPAGLQSLKILGAQPIDYFFSIAKTAELDSLLDFSKYTAIPIDDVPVKIVSDYLIKLQNLQEEPDSLNKLDEVRINLIDSIEKKINKNDSLTRKKSFQEVDSIHLLSKKDNDLRNFIFDKLNNTQTGLLLILEKQLHENKYIVSRFNEKFVLLAHEKLQEMINAYLIGDLAELEKRQYYYGNRQYRRFLSILDVAIHLAPETNYLRRILEINRSYLTGLIDRLEMATQKKTDSLLRSAFYQQRQALKMEPYAAYIHNEIGNLYFSSRLYDSALYHFDFALILSPTWAVPWSNKIRLYLALNNTQKAKEAFRIADSLQRNLAYTNVNVGLVMEKDSNLLAAESYYLNAIAQNNVHYLPYERLGFVYLQTGRYALADSFFMESKKRKDPFAVNNFAFTFGIVQSIAGKQPATKFFKVCSLANDQAVVGWQPLSALAKALIKLVAPAEKNVEGEKLMKEAIDKSPGLVLAHHYLGQKYFTDKNLKEAEKYITEAVQRYIPIDSFLLLIKAQLQASLHQNIKDLRIKNKIKSGAVSQKTSNNSSISSRTDTTCLQAILSYYHYDVREDHYLLANIYEQEERWNEALNQYKIIAAAENKKLMAQAIYQGFKKITLDRNNINDDNDEQINFYESPVRAGATLKAARLLEKQARYEEAEDLLKQQLIFNRKAGYARQAEMNKGNFGPVGHSTFNFFWLNANYDMETETYNFYNRMVSIFPRNADWYSKAGMFLYERLSLTYPFIQIAEQKGFYEYSKKHAYPYIGGTEQNIEGFDEVEKYFRKINMFKLPGTLEKISIEMQDYEPIQTALSWLQQAVKFSGDDKPNYELTKAMTNLQKWMGNYDVAIAGYNTLLKIQPDNTVLRNALIEILQLNKYLPAVANQLDSLHKRKQLSHEQIIKLAYYKILSNSPDKDMSLLAQYTPHNPTEKNLKTSVLIQQFMMTGELKKAFKYLQDSLQTPEKPKKEFTKESVAQIGAFDNPYYTEARILAMTKQDSAAFAFVKELLDSGFAYKNILMNDPAFERLRKTKKWINLLDGHSFPVSVKNDEPQKKIDYSAVKYRIPGSD